MTGRRWRLAMASGLAASLVSITSAPVLAVEPQGTERVSVHTDGTQGNLDSFDAAVSADGRYVAFDSESTNLVAGDTNATFDVFVHDRDTGATERISVHSDGTQGNGESFSRAISADGRYVVFDSAATNLVPGDTNAEHDVFVHDRATGATERISVRSNGAQGNGHSSAGAVSADGRFVAFHSLATNLVDGDTNAERDVFVHDRATGATQRVSIASDGAQSDANSGEPAMSADGRLVAFQSEASNLVAGDTNGVFDIFVHDRATGATERVSVGSDGAQGDGLSLNAAISADGRFVAFDSAATNLVTGDTNALFDVFLHDRWTGATERVSIAGDGAQGDGSSFNPTLSADGRLVAFDSSAPDLVLSDTNGVFDVFVHDRATAGIERASVASDGAQADGDSFGPVMDAEGRVVAFSSKAEDLVAGDTNVHDDIFAVELSAAPLVGVVVVGGTAAVSDDVADGLGALAPGADMARRAGPDRFATAAAVSEAGFSPGVNTVYIATGGNFPDALTAGPAAALDGAPILLVGDTIPAPTADELTRLDPGEIVILGGAAAVSAQIEAALAAYTDGDVIRRAGPDRFATAAAVSEASFDPGIAKVYIATGGNFPDGLTAGPAAALDSAPILLVGDIIPDPTATELTRLAGG